MQKIRRFKLALLLVARTIALSLPTPIPFALHTHRRHCLSSFSYRAIIFPYSRHPPPPLSPLLPRLFHHYHCSFTSTPTSTRYLARPDLNPACAVPCKKGALKRFLLAMGTLSPTPYRMYHVPHITNATFLLSCHPPPCSPKFRLPRAFSLPLTLSFLHPGPHQCFVLRLACETGYIGRGNPYLDSATLASVVQRG